jgi:hypothetical protein
MRVTPSNCYSTTAGSFIQSNPMDGRWTRMDD